MSENDTQKLIIEWLWWNKIFHYKNNTVGIYKKSTGSYIPSQSVGSPDIICVVDGKFIGIEVKAKNGKQSPAQKEFQGRLTLAGGKYILAYDLDDVIAVLKK